MGLHSKAVRLSGVVGKWDPNVIQVGDYFLDETTGEFAEVIKVSGYGIKVVYHDGRKKTLSMEELYRRPGDFSFATKSEIQGDDSVPEQEMEGVVSGSDAPAYPDPNLMRHWVYVASTESLGIIEAVDYNSQPVTLSVRVFPNGPLNWEQTAVVTLPVTAAQLVKNFDLYQQPVSFSRPFAVQEFPELTGMVEMSAFMLTIPELLKQFNHVWVFIPEEGSLGLVRTLPDKDGNVQVGVYADRPLIQQTQPEKNIVVPQDKLVPLRNHKLVSELHRAGTYRQRIDYLRQTYPENYVYTFI